ncbi:hypothetical protein EC396_12070 [Lutibacter sp. HS1-25]|uniref:hypothetical protein n=1 Tax=Lutibacter sp. HS1-25 TaxID=2485000 RepID=UPI0010121D5A|nr:hypothetical protein [Lutibacter sp. HS1-25]RXP51945.1 hypothetical protein EC396_12070 [Lutibacter sp. HS1-25]
MIAESKNISLRVEIKNKEPLELIELTKSLTSLSNQYNSYSENNGFTEDERHAKLYIKEIKSGSVILDLMEYASIGVIPFVENVNTIVGFADYFGKAVKYFIKGDGEKPELTIQDCKDLSQIVSPIAKDNGSQLNMSVKIDGDFHQHIYLDSRDANALQNLLKQEIKEKLEPKTGDLIENAIMVFYQTRNKIDGVSGNKVIIDDAVKGKPLNVVFADKKLKRKILKGDYNPNNFAFQVDVKIKTSDGKIIAYEVIKYHDKFPLEDV